MTDDAPGGDDSGYLTGADKALLAVGYVALVVLIATALHYLAGLDATSITVITAVAALPLLMAAVGAVIRSSRPSSRADFTPTARTIPALTIPTPAFATTEALPVPSARARDYPLTRRRLRRGLVRQAVGIVVALGAFAPVFTVQTISDNTQRDLQAMGVATTGTVVQIVHDSSADSHIDVSYLANGSTRIGEVYIGGSVRQYRVGQSVPVRYRANDPATMSIGGVYNNAAIDTGLFVFFSFVLLFGAIALPIFIALEVRWIRMRRAAGRGPWQPITATVRAATFGRVHLTDGATGQQLRSVIVQGTMVTSSRSFGRPMWVTGTGRWRLAVDDPDRRHRLLFVRERAR